MKICFISKELPPETHFGGTGTYTFNTARALAKLGHEVSIISETNKKTYTYVEDGVFIRRIKRNRFRPKEFKYLWRSYQVAKILKGVGYEFDVVQANEWNAEAFWYSYNQRAPLITRLATPRFLEEELSGLGSLRRRYLIDFMERKQTENSQGIISSTKALAKVVSDKWKIDPSRLVIIPNAIDLGRVERLGAGVSPLPLAEQDYLLYFGRLEERKGVHILAQALPAVLSHYPKLKVVFVGASYNFKDMPMEEYVARLNRNHLNNLIFLGNLPQERLFPLVKGSTLVILPSLWEAFGFVCVEAMCLGKAVIATKGSGFEEVIEDRVSGYLVEPGDYWALQREILNCLENRIDLKRVEENAKRRARDFDVYSIAKRLSQYYENIIKRGTRN